MLIAVVNHSTLIAAPGVQRGVDACHRQLRYHVGPTWDRHSVPVILYPDETAAPKGSQFVVLLDDADQAGALGYHDETPQGAPYSRVFVRTSEQAGVTWESVLSHEVIEMFLDPGCQMWAQDARDPAGTLYALEGCDAVEGDSYPVGLPGGDHVELSNFVLPSWFDAGAPEGSRLDWMHQLAKPFSMNAGGYVIVMTNGRVSQQYAEVNPVLAATKEWPASRTARRLGSGA